MKDKIINILQAETWNVTNQAGDLCTVIDEEDFNDIAERIVKLFNIPDVSQQRELLSDYNNFINNECVLAGGILTEFEIKKFQERNCG